MKETGRIHVAASYYQICARGLPVDNSTDIKTLAVAKGGSSHFEPRRNLCVRYRRGRDAAAIWDVHSLSAY